MKMTDACLPMLVAMSLLLPPDGGAQDRPRSILGKDPAECSPHAERCVNVMTVSTTFNQGVASCIVEVPFSLLKVPQSKIRNKKIRVVFVLRNNDPLDGNVYRFRPESGIIVNDGFVFSPGAPIVIPLVRMPLPLPLTPNDQSKDFAHVGMDSADMRRYAWTSVNARRGVFPFDIHAQRHDPEHDQSVQLRPRIPYIYNVD